MSATPNIVEQKDISLWSMMKNTAAGVMEGGSKSAASAVTRLGAAIAKQAYSDLVYRAESAYAVMLGEANLNPTGKRRKLYLATINIDRDKAKRQFNTLANWFYQGDFSLWFSAEMGEHVISKAKRKALEHIARSKKVYAILRDAELKYLRHEITAEQMEEYRRDALAAEGRYAK